MLMLCNATSGGVPPAAFLPDWLHPFSDILPAGLGLRALIGASYFNNDGYVSGLILLAIWIVVSLGIVTPWTSSRIDATTAPSTRPHPKRRHNRQANCATG